MYVRSLLLATALLALAGCAGNVTVPPPGLEHPANPKAAAAPLPPSPTIPEVSKPMRGGMQGMNHGSMQGMDHGSMEGMRHGSMQGMQGVDHGSMQDMEGLTHGAMPEMDARSMKGMEGMQGMQGMEHPMEGMPHAY
jgi:hypothetical protein